MKMLVFESSFQRALPKPCRPTNNFYRVPKVLKIKKLSTPWNFCWKHVVSNSNMFELDTIKKKIHHLMHVVSNSIHFNEAKINTYICPRCNFFVPKKWLYIYLLYATYLSLWDQNFFFYWDFFSKYIYFFVSISIQNYVSISIQKLFSILYIGIQLIPSQSQSKYYQQLLEETNALKIIIY